MKALNSCTNSFAGCGTVPASGSDVVFKWTTQTVNSVSAEWLPRSAQVKFRSQYLWSAYSFVQPQIGKSEWTYYTLAQSATWKRSASTRVRLTPQPPSFPVRHQDYNQSEFLHLCLCLHLASDGRADLFLCLSFCRYQDVKVSRGGESRGELTIGGCRWDALCWAACGERSSCVIIFFFFKYLTHKLMCWIGSDQFLTFSSSSYTDSERNGPESNHQVRVALRSPPSSSISFQIHLMLRSFLFTHYGQRYEAKRIRLWSKSSL